MAQPTVVHAMTWPAVAHYTYSKQAALKMELIM